MKRREFITLLGGVAATWPMAARAQQAGGAMPLLGFVSQGFETDPEWQARRAALREALATLGWADGRNIRITYRWGANSTEQRRAAAAEMVGLAPNVILTYTTPISQALQQATPAIPIVFVGASDPVSSGLVNSMSRPGGNLTGFTNYEFPMGGKWLEVLKEVAPSIKRVLVLMPLDNMGSQGFLRAIEAAAPALGTQIATADVLDNAAMMRAINAFAQEPNGGLLMLPGTPPEEQRDLIVGFAARHRLPAIYAYRPFIASGGLMSYDTDMIDLIRRAASYIDRILRGEKPGDLPVQGPTKFELVINLKAAKALGLTVPLPLLARADEVIE